MNSTGHFEEDDLALYAMHLLAEPEASAMARRLAESPEARQQLAEVQARLAAFAEATVELQAVPEGSLDRLMGRISLEKKILPMPAAARESASEREPRSPGSPGGKVLPWIGWAVAAGFAVAAGKLYHDRAAMHTMLSAQTGQVEHMSAETTGVYRERDSLKSSVAEQARELEALRSDVAAAKSQADTAKSAAETARDEAASLQSASAALNAQLKDQTARTAEQTTLAANAVGERDRLRSTLAAQASEVARLSGEAARAQQVLDALTDRTALRVVLTQPKTNAAPTGRATYVAGRGTLVFLANNLAPLQPNKVYQLWLMPADGSKPIPAGTFAPDARGNASIVSEQFPQPVPAKGFAVTIENEGGALSPTLPIILAGF